jgi:polar amino acid transport system substrate-binding protein
MNRRDALTTVALAGAAIAAASGSAKADAPASTLDRIKKNGVLRVAVIVGQEPYFHKDLATNEWSGACIDMAKDIAGKLGAKVETLESTWGNQILDLQADKVDLAFAVNPTPERALVIDFSTPILVHSFTVITKKGFAKPQTWAELNKPEVKIAVDIGSTHETIARRYCPKATILGFNMGIRAESDRRYKDFLSAWADYNRAMGQTREWMLKGFEAVGLTADDLPPEVQF